MHRSWVPVLDYALTPKGLVSLSDYSLRSDRPIIARKAFLVTQMNAVAKAILKRMRKALSDKMKEINDEFLPFTDYREKFMAKDDPYSIVAGAKGPFKGPYAAIPSTRAKRKKK